MKAYAGNDLDGNLLRAVSYSLQKAFVKFGTLEVSVTWKDSENVSNPAVNYFWKIPFRFLTTGRFFTTLFDVSGQSFQAFSVFAVRFGQWVMLVHPFHILLAHSSNVGVR